MKTISIAAVLAATTLLAPVAMAKDTIVVVSPFGTAVAKLDEMKAITSHFVETVDPGEQAIIIDGLTQAQIAEYHLPQNGKDYSSAKRRMKAVPEFFRDIKAFADAAQPASGQYHPGQIDLEATLRVIGQDYLTGTAQDVIFYAISPIGHDPRSPDYSMRDGAISNDAGLAASRYDWRYGSAEDVGKLENVTVHWGMTDQAWAINDRHVFSMERYLSNAFTLRGATLATLSTEPAAALRNAKKGLDRPIGAFEFEPDGTPTMLSYQPVVALPKAVEQVPIYQRDISERTPSRAETRLAQNVEIAIRWRCDCDFDIAVQPVGKAPISYRTVQTDDGRLFKDFTSSGDLNNGWETVELRGPLDLAATRVAVNLFRGPNVGEDVELRVAIDGETWAQTLRLSGSADGGRGFRQSMRTGAAANAAWVVTTAAQVTGASR